MEAEDVKNPIWKQIVTGQKKVPIGFLAGKILLSRLLIDVKNAPEKAGTAAQELFDLYLKNQQLPSVKRDLTMLLGR